MGIDTVQPSILLEKMYHYGVRGCVLDWFRSFLPSFLPFVTHFFISSSFPEFLPISSFFADFLFVLPHHSLPSFLPSFLPFFLPSLSHISRGFLVVVFHSSSFLSPLLSIVPFYFFLILKHKKEEGRRRRRRRRRRLLG